MTREGSTTYIDDAEQELVPGRGASSRKGIVAAGLTDANIEALIKRAQRECEQSPA